MYNFSQKAFGKLSKLFFNHDKNGGNDVHPDATWNMSGFMSTADKKRLDNLYRANWLADGTDLSTLASGFYQITNAAGGPTDTATGSPILYTIYRTAATRYIESDIVYITAVQISTGRTWDKLFYDGAGNTMAGNKGWNRIFKSESLLSTSQIASLNAGSTVSLDTSRGYLNVESVTITYRIVAGYKTSTFKLGDTISIRDFNLSDSDPEKNPTFFECRIAFDRTNKKISAIKTAMQFDNTTQQMIKASGSAFEIVSVALVY